MKYIININQKAIMSLGLDLDIIDMAIFDEVYCYMQSSRRQKLSTPEGEFFLILPRYIIDDMPLLGVKSEAVIRRHLAKIADAGLLVRYSHNFYMCLLLIRAHLPLLAEINFLPNAIALSGHRTFKHLL